MKYIVAATSLALSLSFGAAFAQQAAPAQDPGTAQSAPATGGERHHHAPNPQKQAEHLSRQLNLTPDQTAKIEPILASRDGQMQALWQNQQLTPQDRHQQMRSINEQSEQQMSGVLNPDQMDQLKAMRHHGHHGQAGQGNEDQSNQAPSA